MTIISAAQRIKQILTPSRNPSAGEVLTYFKGDGKQYAKNSAAIERLLSQSAAVLAPVRVAGLLNNYTLSGAQTVDGVAVATGDRVLMRGQTVGNDNGIYVANTAGAWTRAPDADLTAEIERGTQVYVIEGTSNKFKVFQQGVTSAGAVGTWAQEWRVIAYADIAGGFNFPTPNGTGHLYFNQNSQTLYIWDSVVWRSTGGVVVCTSTTRPAFPSEGMIIFESDTGMSYFREGGAWRPLVPDPLTVGELRTNKIDSNPPGSTDIVIGSSMNAGGHTFYGFPTPVNDDWVATKKYVDDHAGGGGGSDPVALVPVRQVFTANGTWTKPANCMAVEVEMVGGGGGGGGTAAVAANQAASAPGGGGGGYVKKSYVAADLNATEALVVGQGGNGGAAGNNAGAAGGTSTFKGLTAAGGAGGAGAVGAGNTGQTGAVGGTASGGDLNVEGHDSPSTRVSPLTSSISSPTPSYGGGSVWGGGRRTSGLTGGSPGARGHDWGGGGSGATARDVTAAGAGGNGGDGLVVVTSYVTATAPVVAPALRDARITRVNQSIPDQTTTAIDFDATTYATPSTMADLTANTITIPGPGTWSIEVYASISTGNATNQRTLSLLVDGVSERTDRQWPVTGVAVYLSISLTRRFLGGEAISVTTQQNSGVALTYANIMLTVTESR